LSHKRKIGQVKSRADKEKAGPQHMLDPKPPQGIGQLELPAGYIVAPYVKHVYVSPIIFVAGVIHR